MSDVSDTADSSPGSTGVPPGNPGSGDGLGGILGRAGGIFLRQREASVVLIAVIMFLYFWVSTHGFATKGSFINITQYMAPYTIVAIGECFLMVSGEIDLSVGYVWMFSPFVMHFFVDSGVSTVPAIIITVLLLSLIGFANGFITTVLGVPSLITTLAMGYIIDGYALTVSHAQQINLPDGSMSYAKWFGAGNWSEFIWAVVLVLIFHIVFTRTRWGLYTVSVGGNLLGARESGIKVNRIKIGNFMICSALGAVAGILEAFLRDIIDPSAGGLNVVLVALAGVVIGGTLMAGGSGTVIGAALGVLALGILQDGFNLRGISSNTYLIILGAAILVAMIVNTYLTKLRGAGRVAKA
jgi:simple sugar transport system permease protein